MSRSSSFEAIARDTFYQLLQIHPEYAIQLGVPYEGGLPDLSKDSIMREKGLIMLTLERLKEVNIDSLPFPKKLDVLAFNDYLRLRWFFIEKWPIWKMYPEAPEILFNILLYIYLDPDETLSNKIKTIASFLRETPAFLERSKSRIQQPVRIFVDVSLLMLTALKHFIYVLHEEVTRDPQASRIYASNKRDIESGLQSLDKYIEWIQSLREREIYENIMGRELYDELIKTRKIYSGLDDIYRLLKRMLEERRKRVEAAASDVKPGATPKEVLDMIYEKSPSNQLAAISLYERAIADVRRVLIEKKIVTLKDIPVEVMSLPAPASLRLPIFYYYPTVVREGGVEKATVFIKIPEDPNELKLHNAYFVLHRIIQEIFPGKHLIYTSLLSSENIVRQMLDLPEIVDGWSLYADYLMSELGYANSPIDNFIRNLEIYRSILVAYVDIAVNIGEMKYAEASKFLMERGYLTQNEATSSVIQVLISPTSGLSTYLGYRFFLDIRRRMESMAVRELDRRWFHDEILKNAVLPLPYMEIALIRGYSEYLLDRFMKKAFSEKEL